jgi:hypothetical protein
MIAMAGDQVVMPENAMLVLHDPSGLVAGTAAGADQGQAHLMTVFQGAVDATFAAFDATWTPAGGEPVGVRVIARRPDTIVGFGETRIIPRPRRSSCGRARSPARAPPISSPSMARPSSSRASPSGAIRIGACGRSM